MPTIWNDLRYAFRQLRKSPGFTLTAALTLALGIGANTAVFTLVHAVMLKSLPVADPEQLYQIGDADKQGNWGGFQDSWAVYSYEFYQHMRANTPAFEDIAAFQSSHNTMSVRRSGTSSPADPFGGEFVSGNYFSVFGLQPFAGRMLMNADDTPGSAPVAVITYRAWVEKFGLDRSVIGGTFLIDGKPFTVVGVTPPGFYGDRLQIDPPDFYLPLNQEPNLSEQQGSMLHMPDQGWLYAIGRMKPGQNPSQIGTQLTMELQHWLPEHVRMNPDRNAQLSRQRIGLKPGGAGITQMRSTFHKGLWLLTAASALVLLIACANLANLQLVRSMGRQHQAALQLALGASRRRLIRGVLSESVLLALIGGVAGVLVAYAGTRGILLVLFRGASFIPIDATPSLPILGFAFALSLLTGVLFGVLPALMTARSNPVEALRGASRTTRDSSTLPQKVLVIFQAAFSLVLLAMAGLVTQSLSHMEGGNFGFQTEGRLMVNVDPQTAGYKTEQLTVLYQNMLDRLQQIPGVKNVAFSTVSPQDGDSWNDRMAIAGRSDDRDRRQAAWVRISPQYFDAIGTPLLRGRVIGLEDTATSEHVAVIDESFAKIYFPDEDPIGKHFGESVPGHSGDYTIVGVVRDTRYQHALESQNPMFFLPLTQAIPYNGYVLNQHWEDSSHYIHDIELRVIGEPTRIGPAVRNALASVDPNLTVIDMQSFSEQVNRMYDQERLTARLTGLFGLLALLLASIGIYGVTAYNVARRTSEIGIRMALGADRANVIRMVLRGALTQTGIGLVIGLPLAIFAGRVIASQLYEVGKFDALVLMSAVLVLSVCAVIAGFLPARRAASVEPMRALRTE
ncbi:MAG TPA: ABC transporter permease [Pseudacidobacterium sp.]|jgi:predicted permease|nr:ABC transporter permease [Pseudacidobacterium sp.]